MQPDPAHPDNRQRQLRTGADKEGKKPAGWHYQRQAHAEDGDDAPDGEHYVTFHNDEPGRGCRALQGLAVDGRKVSALRLSFAVRGKDIRAGERPDNWPLMVVTFYDDQRAAVGEEYVGPFYGTFDWRREAQVIRVPLQARAAIVRIGLLGGGGRILVRRFAAAGDRPVGRVERYPLFRTVGG